MRKVLIGTTLAIMLASPAMAIAAPAQDTGGQARMGEHGRRHLTAEDFAALTDARIAALKAGLKLTADQDKMWPALETALRDVAKARADRFAQMRQERQAEGDRKERPDAIERLRLRSDRLSQQSADLKKIADAAEPLYKSLDSSQKARFSLLMRNTVGPRPARWHGRPRAE